MMNERPYFIGIAGASCSGKTLLARRLMELLPGSSVMVALDSYYLDLSHLPLEERAQSNFDAPGALDHEALDRDLQALARGDSVELPEYDFTTHTRTAARRRIAPAAYILVEGILALHWAEVRARFSTRVFIAVDNRVCLARRLARDVAERGRTEDSVIAQYTGTVRPMYRQYCAPTLRFANVIVRGEDPVAQSAAVVLKHVLGGPLSRR